MKQWEFEYPYSMVPRLTEAISECLKQGDYIMARRIWQIIKMVKTERYAWIDQRSGMVKMARDVRPEEVLKKDEKKFDMREAVV